MSIETSTATSTHLSQPDTSRETYIGVYGPSGQWTQSHDNEYWRGDFLYLRKGRYYEHLDQIDGGQKNGFTWWNQPYFTFLDNRDLIDTISMNLELYANQKRKAITFYLDQDLGKWGIRKDLVAWATCAYIVHSDREDIRKCHPQTPEEDCDAGFLEAADGLRFSMREREKTYGKVQNALRIGWS